jgi:hypothetical protein
MTVIDCPHGGAPERMPKADATGLAPKKSADHNPPVHDSFAGGFGLLQVTNQAYFFGEVLRAEALGLKRGRPPGRLCRAFRIPIFCSSAVGIPLVPTQPSILSHSRAPSTPRAGHTGKESENAAGEKADTFGGKQCDPLQYERLTGHSLRECPVCHRGHMIPVANLPGVSSSPVIEDTS